MADTEPADTTDSLELVDSNPTDNSDQPRILVIEDNREVAYYIGSQLKENYEIYYATNGRMGLEKAEQLMPDLIVTDLMMPEIDGLEFCRSVRASELLCHIPIIVITARSSDDDLVRGINAGADAYLTKPFKAIELKVRVGKLLEQRHLLAEKYSHALATENSNPDTQLPSGQDAKFIGRMTDTVYSLMGRGQADVDSVASALCMSASQLRRKVQALTGKTPAAYILQIRLSNAQRLLDKNPDLTMADVALRCGFSDQAHFSHAFQKAFGMSPTQWAHRAR
jgi:CheY-like chemotaxis protein